MILCRRYRLLPRKSQHRALERILESQRQLYNAALEERIGAYRKAGIAITYFDQTRELTEWRGSDSEASELPVNLQRATLKRLDEAYNGFFRRVKKGGKPGFPRFRGKGWFDSFGFREFAGITLEKRGLRFRGMPGNLRVHWHRDPPDPASIKSCTFKRDPKGWSVAFATSVEPAAMRSSQRTAGIDLGISTFAAFSDGGFIPSLKAARKAERRLRLAQRTLLRYKAERAGARLIEVDPRNTSQECSGCGTEVPKDLGDRRHDCPRCGLSIDRDINAARNVLNRAGVGPGLRNVAGCGMRAGENLDSERWARQASMAPN